MIKRKKFPILSYLCYLLVVSVLFTGVTFSRYTSAVSGDLSIGVSPFIASYTIEDISSNTYTNANFWINATGHQQGTARSVRFSFRNYATREDGSVLRVSDVPLTAHLRVEIPAEFADRLVLQVASDDGESAVMPQIVLGNLIYQVSDAPQTHYMDGVPEDYYDYITSAQNGEQVFATSDYFARRTGSLALNTAYFRDYSSREGADDCTLSLSGLGFTQDGIGSVVAEGPFGRITVQAEERLVQYAVGFQRETLTGDILPQLYLDLERAERVYTIDIELNDLLSFDGGTAQERQCVLYLSLAERIAASDYDMPWEQEATDTTEAYSLDELLEVPTGNSLKTFNGDARVTGYHFDFYTNTFTLATYAFEPTGNQTQIRVHKRFVSNEQGGFTEQVSFSHVAPVSESAFYYVHPISEFYNANGEQVTDLTLMEHFQEVYGLCSNFAENNRLDYYISLDNIPDNPFYSSYDAQIAGGAETNVILSSLSKTYFTTMVGVFTQVAGANAGGNS